MYEHKVRVEDEVAKVEAKGGGANTTCWGMFGVGAILTFANLLFSLPTGSVGDPTPVFEWLPFGTYTGIFTIIMLVCAWGLEWIRSTPTRLARDARSETLERAFAADPLVRRAKLLVAASKEYQAHCARYRERRAQVDEGIAPAQPEADDAWHALIVRSHDAILRALENFQHVTERLQREAKLGTAPGEGALAELLALEGRADAVPALATSQTDPAHALEDERKLSATMRELHATGATT